MHQSLAQDMFFFQELQSGSSMASGSADPNAPTTEPPEAADALFDDAEDVTAVSSQLWSPWPTAEDYLDWWTQPSGYRPVSSWWPAPPPSALMILAEMRAEATMCLPRAPILEPHVTASAIPKHHEIATSKSIVAPKAKAAILRDIQRVTSENRSNEVRDDPPLRHGREGLGYTSPVLKDRHISDKEVWSGEGYPARCIQVFSWKAGFCNGWLDKTR